MCLRRLRVVLMAACALVGSAQALAEVKPNALFTDHMVLQRDKPVKVWGTAAADEKVSVRIGEQSVDTTAKDGKWQVELKPLTAGGPHTLTIEGANKIELANVLIGEVWIASGQSNMQWTIKQSEDPEKVAAEARRPRIRLFTVKRDGASEPQENVEGRWDVCSPETVGDFSAVAYHFGAALHKQLDVPIGLISTNVGGTAAQRWTPKEVLDSTAELKKYAEEKNAGDLYNAMIHPLLKFRIKGAIWYQGESNAGEAHRYRVLFPAMIKSWRDRWDQGDFPFLFVQLAPWVPSNDPTNATWAELREAQLMTLSKSPNTAMAVITDVGDEKDIHPKPKKPVGERLALAARALAYGEKIEYSGPIFESLTTSGERAILRFKHAGEGLEVRGEKLTGFAVAGEDKKFHNAEAKIEGDTVIVSSSEVNAPLAVRFGWANYPAVNLWNKNGLPGSPFRTDSWPGVTEGK
ncbi:MAG: sialate O-acetylesterase [Pirellulales bacterium]